MDEQDLVTTFKIEVTDDFVHVETDHDSPLVNPNDVKMEQDMNHVVRTNENDFQEKSTENEPDNETNNQEMVATLSCSNASESDKNLNSSNIPNRKSSKLGMSGRKCGGVKKFPQNYKNKKRQQKKRKTGCCSPIPSMNGVTKRMNKVSRMTKVSGKKPTFLIDDTKRLNKIIKEKNEVIQYHMRQLKELHSEICSKDEKLEELQNQVRNLEAYKEKSKLGLENVVLKQKLVQRELTELQATLSAKGTSVANFTPSTTYSDCVVNGTEDLTEGTGILEKSEEHGNVTLLQRGVTVSTKKASVDYKKKKGDATPIANRSSIRRTATKSKIDISDLVGSNLDYSAQGKGTSIQCQYCDKRYIRKGNYTIHLRKHSGGPKFNCTFCEKKFYEMGKLINHFAADHSSKNGRMVLNNLPASSKKIKHMRLGGKTTFQCCFCGKEHATKKGFVQHIEQRHIHLVMNGK